VVELKTKRQETKRERKKEKREVLLSFFYTLHCWAAHDNDGPMQGSDPREFVTTLNLCAAYGDDGSGKWLKVLLHLVLRYP
jgi:hypothetical protein